MKNESQTNKSTHGTNLIYKANKWVKIMKQFNLQKKSFILINGRRQHKIQGRKTENKSKKTERR